MHQPVFRASACAAGSIQARASTQPEQYDGDCQLDKIARAEADRIVERQE